MAIKNHTYRNHMIVLNRIMKKGYTFSEADVITRNVFSNYGDGNGHSVEWLTEQILSKEDYINEYGKDASGSTYEEFSHEESPIIGEYLDGCNALLHRSADGYRISTAEEDIEFKTADEVIAFMKETIDEWKKVSAR